MTDERDILAERVRRRIEALGRNPRDVSIAVTGKPDLVRDIYRRRRMPTGPVMLALADELATTVDYLHGKAETAEQVASEVAVRELPTLGKEIATILYAYWGRGTARTSSCRMTMEPSFRSSG